MIHTVTIVIPETGFMIQLYQMKLERLRKERLINERKNNNERIATQ